MAARLVCFFGFVAMNNDARTVQNKSLTRCMVDWHTVHMSIRNNQAGSVTIPAFDSILFLDRRMPLSEPELFLKSIMPYLSLFIMLDWYLISIGNTELLSNFKTKSISRSLPLFQ